ncbi:MAG: KEOPS complex subunit Pcc1 [Candidatus Bathyarchaeia archaeon]
MEAEAEIVLIFDDIKVASVVSSSVSPDNLDCPEGLTVDTQSLDNKVITTVRYHGENIATFLSTIDDLLSCISTAEKAIMSVREQE